MKKERNKYFMDLQKDECEKNYVEMKDLVPETLYGKYTVSLEIPEKDPREIIRFLCYLDDLGLGYCIEKNDMFIAFHDTFAEVRSKIGEQRGRWFLGKSREGYDFEPDLQIYPSKVLSGTFAFNDLWTRLGGMTEVRFKTYLSDDLRYVDLQHKSPIDINIINSPIREIFDFSDTGSFSINVTDTINDLMSSPDYKIAEKGRKRYILFVVFLELYRLGYLDNRGPMFEKKMIEIWKTWMEEQKELRS
jgi:hypothetical protein